jgi:hypothetical protein
MYLQFRREGAGVGGGGVAEHKYFHHKHFSPIFNILQTVSLLRFFKKAIFLRQGRKCLVLYGTLQKVSVNTGGKNVQNHRKPGVVTLVW